MKIQKTRFAAIASALSLVITGFVGAQPASAAATSPAWDTVAANGGVPLVTISGSIVTVVSIPAPVRTGGLSSGFPRIYSCNQALTSAGFSYWAAPVGQPIYPPAGAIGGADCFEIGVASNGATLDLSTASLLSGGSYVPQTHGTHIIAGWRDYDNFGTLGGSPANQDDLIWVSHGLSVEYIPPAPPTVTAQPTLALSGTTIQFSAATFSGGTGSVSNSIYSCPSQKVAVTTPTPNSGLGLGSCHILYNVAYSNALATDLSTALVFINNNYIPFSASTHGSHILGRSQKSSLAVLTGSVNSAGGPVVSESTPYTGPIVTPPAAVSFRPGGKALLPGSNLSGVSKVSVDGLDANVKVNSAGELEITVPSSLKPGVYDLVIVSDSGTLTVQDGLRVAAGSGSVGATSEASPSTKLKEDNTVKVWVFDVVGAGKVQIFHNGKEIAWVNTTDSSDSKLTSGYLVRTVDLAPGKNVIEVYVDGERVKRAAYTR